MNRINRPIAAAVFATAFILSVALFLLARSFQGPFILLFWLLTWPSYLVGGAAVVLAKWQFDPGRFSSAALYLLVSLFCGVSAGAWSLLIGYLARSREEPNQTLEPTR